jgi:hypothetical protein
VWFIGLKAAAAFGAGARRASAGRGAVGHRSCAGAKIWRECRRLGRNSKQGVLRELETWARVCRRSAGGRRRCIFVVEELNKATVPAIEFDFSFCDRI